MSNHRNRQNFRNREMSKKGSSGNGNKRSCSVSSDQDNPVIANFRQFALELDDKHDRYERIVKQSRDITIESKRIIFLLHTVDLRKDNYEQNLAEAKSRLMKLCSTNFASIAEELQGRDPYQYARAYSAGLQEFIEAYTFFEYITGEIISDWEKIQSYLIYDNIKNSKENDENQEAPIHENTTGISETSALIEKCTAVNEPIKINDNIKVDTSQKCLIQPIEYILGLADLTGEIMRRCINSLGSGDIEICFQSCKFLQSLYSGFLGIGPTWNREMSRKFYTLRQSLLKSEHVCYNVKVRGKEAAKWDADERNIDPSGLEVEEDEGFY